MSDEKQTANQSGEVRPPETPPVLIKPPEPNGVDGCLVAIGKAILIIAIGVFVLASLVFATCFLSVRR